MRSIEDIQAWLNNHTIMDAKSDICNKYIKSALGLDDSIKFICSVYGNRSTFEDLRDFVHSEPEKIEIAVEKTTDQYLSEILDEIRGIHEILKADVLDNEIISKLDKDELESKLNQYENTNFS